MAKTAIYSEVYIKPMNIVWAETRVLFVKLAVYKINSWFLRFKEIKFMTKDVASYLRPHKSVPLYFTSDSLTPAHHGY